MKQISTAPSFMASMTSSSGGWTARTRSASATSFPRSAMNTTSLNAASASLIASPAPVCMCSFAPSLMSLGTTEGTKATRSSCGWLSFSTATLTYIGRSGSFDCRDLWDGPLGDEACLVVQRRCHALERCFGFYVTNQFLVHELLDAHIAQLASVAGVFDPAKREFGVGPGDVVYEHHSSLDAAGHALAAGKVLGEDRTAQPEIGVIGERDRLVLILDHEEQRNGAEEFLSEGRIVRFDVSQNGRLHIRS